MKTLALFAALLACACASPTAVIDHRALDCSAGNDISVEAGLDDGTNGGRAEATGQREYLVRVTNNAHEEVTVKTIRIDPSDRVATGLDSVAKEFNHTIAENDEYIFHLPVNAPWNRGVPERPPVYERTVVFSVIVALTNGDSYRCQFESAAR